MSENGKTAPAWGALTSNEFQSNEKWWPNSLNLRILHQSHPDSSPFGSDYDYREALADVDIDELTRDVDALMTDSQDWWPADWGHYGPFFIRMSWHAAGTYRVNDGRGGAGTGAQRFAPLNSWPDNGNLDKARRLLLPIKQKYGQKISWADLMVFAGNRALETMGFRTAGFSFGRADIWAPEDDIYWGPENEWLATHDERYTGSFEDGSRTLDNPLAAVQMGLIYVNPEGPNGVPDAMKSAQDIRETFGRMAMNDEETVALTVGGHTFGKMHGNAPADAVGAEPESGSFADQGFGWANSHETGLGEYTITSGLEGAWTPTPTKWDNTYLDTIFVHEWELVESPAGAKQWQPREVKDGYWVPDAHVEGKVNPPTMSTADMAMITDPAYLEISKRFHENPDQLADAFAKAWFKLLHRDMGPASRYVGPQVPAERFVWQDNNPAHEGPMIGDAEIAELKSTLLDSGLSTAQLVLTAWASASTYRRTDFRGGADGARIRLSPMIDWDANVSSGVPAVIAELEKVQASFNAKGGAQVSIADLIVLGGCAAVEAAAKAAGHDITVPFTPGRTDATQDDTDIDSFQFLEPTADGFRNYVKKFGAVPTEHLLIDKAFLLDLTAPEMTALVGGLRVLGANVGDEGYGVFTDRVGALTNDFFVNLIDMGTKWASIDESEDVFEGRDRATGEPRWKASRVDLVFGANSQLRAIAEEYGAAGGEALMLEAFVRGWVKVMENDRFDLHA
ncbi:catalase/peroxidase HPI [Rhabdothermincola salaria]|uniref:catalase/peroxidase HPI n=1 Tax=Rhabdothermincola salaria TaxID=2903142 RepID=UPI001E3CB6AA|nr:catalase/peroxidase HPI [Rhabdothermincola salaria]MCD9625662.1 catalase/peroxidase HPI [Rhabdothermincola salaria]